MLLSMKELELVLRSSGNVYSFFSVVTVSCLNPTKQAVEKQGTKFRSVFIFLLVVLTWHMDSLSKAIKVVRFIRCCTANET